MKATQHQSRSAWRKSQLIQASHHLASAFQTELSPSAAKSDHWTPERLAQLSQTMAGSFCLGL